MATPSANNSVRPADHNRAMRIALIREWDRLLALATKPGAKGTIGIEVSFIGGKLGDEPKITHVQRGFVD